MTWAYGEVASPADVSEVELRLAPAGDQKTTLVLEHTAIVPEDRWDEYGPGAVGVGWDGGVLGLTLHLRGGSVGDPMAWAVSDEGRDFYKRSSEAWGEANRAAGADPEAVARGVRTRTSSPRRSRPSAPHCRATREETGPEVAVTRERRSRECSQRSRRRRRHATESIPGLGGILADGPAPTIGGLGRPRDWACHDP